MFMLFQQKCCKQKLPQCNTMSTLKHLHPTCPKERAAWNKKQLFLEILRKRIQYETCSVPQRKHRFSGQTADQQTVENTKSNTRVLNPTVQSCHIADTPLVRERKQGLSGKPKSDKFSPVVTLVFAATPRQQSYCSHLLSKKQRAHIIRMRSNFAPQEDQISKVFRTHLS